MLITCIMVFQAFSNGGFFNPKAVATWDFSQSRASSIVAWPTDKTRGARDWWAPPKHTFKRVTIVLSGRPRLVSDYPANVLLDRRGGQITKITINERPVTREQALERLRSLAKEWGWRWEEAEYQKWARSTDAGTTMSIGAGDHPNSKKIPYTSAGIMHAAATPDRPWYVQLHVAWPEALPPPYGTAK